jgi:hypothetical protein
VQTQAKCRKGEAAAFLHLAPFAIEVKCLLPTFLRLALRREKSSLIFFGCLCVLIHTKISYVYYGESLPFCV